MWVARDKDGTMTVFRRMPRRSQMTMKTFSSRGKEKTEEFWDEVNDGYNGTKAFYPGDCYEFDCNAFPDLKWEDEPIEVIAIPTVDRIDGYIVRNEDGVLQIFRKEPERFTMNFYAKDHVTLESTISFWDLPEEYDEKGNIIWSYDSFDMDGDVFSDLTWDDEPVPVQFVPITK